MEGIIPEGHQLFHICRTVVFPPGGFGRLLGKIWVFQHPIQQLRNHLAAGSQLAAIVIAQLAAGDAGSQRIHYHVARAGVEGGDIFQTASGRKQGDVADAADVLQRHILGFAAIQQKFGVGDQRCAQPAGSHIPDAEIADHRASKFFGKVGGVTDLQCSPNAGAQIGGLLGNVIDGLPMAANQVHMADAGLRQQTPHGLGIELSQMGAQEAQLPASAEVAAANI